jgi:hypothetical protein
VNDAVEFRKYSTPQMKERYLGVMETVWSSVSSFLNGYYGKTQEQQSVSDKDKKVPDTFRAMFEQVNKLVSKM